MLDALSDFWKPQKKSQEKLASDQLQVGSAIVFGFVPQASLSGRRLQINAINTYQFGAEALTSFALTQDRGPGISMIVAESEGEQYLAISRRITVSDRIKMFESADIENVTEKAEATQLACKENSDFKGWTVANYRREIQSMKGLLFAGDFRKMPLPSLNVAQEFKYTLLASENNEHAIEIEKYPDGRIEMYATVYRRTSDIGEVSHPMRPDLKLAAANESMAPVVEKKIPEPKMPEVKIPEQKPEEKPNFFVPPMKVSPVKLTEFPAPATVPAPAPKPVQAAAPAANPKPLEEKKPMYTEPAAAAPQQAPRANGGQPAPKFSSVVVTPASDVHHKQEVKTVSKMMNGLDNDAVECDLRVANKIIDEAIRNEMRLSDVVRRIIELPVANQEAVQIPVTLSDEDYSLLAIRYGMSANDKNAIKSRIVEDLNSFSGKKAA